MSHQPNVCPHSQSVCLLVKLVLYALLTTKVPSGRPGQTQVNKLIVFVPIHNHFCTCLFVLFFVCLFWSHWSYLRGWLGIKEPIISLSCLFCSLIPVLYISLTCVYSLMNFKSVFSLIHPSDLKINHFIFLLNLVIEYVCTVLNKQMFYNDAIACYILK